MVFAFEIGLQVQLTETYAMRYRRLEVDARTRTEAIEKVWAVLAASPDIAVSDVPFAGIPCSAKATEAKEGTEE